MRRRALVLTCAVAAALASIGFGARAVHEEPGPPTVAQLQQCPPSDAGGDRNSFIGELLPVERQTYVVADRLRVTGSLPTSATERTPVSTVELDGVERLAGSAELGSARLVRRDAELLVRTNRPGSRLVFKAYDVPARPPYLIPVAVLRPDGEVVFVLFCGNEGDRAATALQGRGAATGRRADEVLLAALRAPDGPDARAVAAAYAAPEPLPWAQRPPDGRDYSDAPQEVRRQLHELLVEVIVPSEWRSFPDIVCARTPVARGHGCAALGAFSDTRAAHLHLGVTVQDGQPLEIVLTDETTRGGRVLGRVAEPQWRAALDAQRTLVLRAPDDLTDRQELLDRLGQGPVLTEQ